MPGASCDDDVMSGMPSVTERLQELQREVQAGAREPGAPASLVDIDRLLEEMLRAGGGPDYRAELAATLVGLVEADATLRVSSLGSRLVGLRWDYEKDSFRRG